MHLFPETFLTILVVVALGLTGLGAVTLLVLLLRDHRDKRLW
jgi:hypothetical protein